MCLLLCAFARQGAAGPEPRTPDAERAERLFLAGREAMKAHHYEQACAEFSESQRLDPASGTLLNLAVCREAQGRTATAWEHYRQGLILSRREANTDGERLALERIQALEPTLCRLSIEPPAQEPLGLVLALDAIRVERSNWRKSLPVDPGTHVVEASAPHRKSWFERITIVEQGSVREVHAPSLDAETTMATAPPLHDTTKPSKSGPPPAVIAFAAVSAVGLSSTAYFGLRARSEWDTRNRHCPQKMCDDTAVAASDRASLFALLADGSAAVGIAAAGAAAYFALFPARPKTAQQPSFGLRVTTDHVSVSLKGTF